MAGGIEVMDPPQRATIRPKISEAVTRTGQAGRGDSLHCQHIQPCCTSTRAPLRGVCKRRRPHENHRQDHPDVSYQRSCLAAGTA